MKGSGLGWCSSGLVEGKEGFGWACVRKGKEWVWLGLTGLVYGKEGLCLGKGTTYQQGLDLTKVPRW